VPQAHFIINPSSGAGAGARLAQQLERLGGPLQVSLLGRSDLSAVISRLGPADVAVACGGDGTASAVADAIAERGSAGPVLGLVPLGTGNDLARALGWSAAGGDLPALLAALHVAGRRQLDRWRVEGPGLARSWCNYLSLGVDARVAQRFHDLRRRHPRLVRGGVINRSLYGVLGVQQRAIDLVRLVRLADAPALPPWSSVLVLGNIPSYAGGATLARGMRCDDGVLEMLALGHGLSLGLVMARLRRPRLLRRITQLEFDLGHGLAMQVDGEPFAARPGRYRVVRDRSITVLVAHGAPCAI
jgi:diacylglycerol kinase family enzyme